MTTPAEDFAASNLEAFKQRMRIATDDAGELSNLSVMLEASYVDILRLTGAPDATDPAVKELIFDRARYVYNDALDEFLGNYEQNIYNLHLVYCSDGYLDGLEIDDSQPSVDTSNLVSTNQDSSEVVSQLESINQKLDDGIKVKVSSDDTIDVSGVNE